MKITVLTENTSRDAGLIGEHGLSLYIETQTHRILFDMGQTDIAAHFQPDVLIGGFHLNKVEAEEILQTVGCRLAAFPTQYYTGHCTGSRQYEILKAAMGDQLEVSVKYNSVPE